MVPPNFLTQASCTTFFQFLVLVPVLFAFGIRRFGFVNTLYGTRSILLTRVVPNSTRTVSRGVSKKSFQLKPCRRKTLCGVRVATWVFASTSDCVGSRPAFCFPGGGIFAECVEWCNRLRLRSCVQRSRVSARRAARGRRGFRTRARPHLHGDLGEDRAERRGGLHPDRACHLREDPAGPSRHPQWGACACVGSCTRAFAFLQW